MWPCDFECSATCNLNWHKTNKFKCDHCDFESFTTGNLRRHTKKSKVKCDQHGFEIYIRGDLKKRMSKNTSKCDQCNFEWSAKGKMIWHKKSKIKCDQCDFEFYTRGNLTFKQERRQIFFIHLMKAGMLLLGSHVVSGKPSHFTSTSPSLIFTRDSTM